MTTTHSNSLREPRRGGMSTRKITLAALLAGAVTLATAQPAGYGHGMMGGYGGYGPGMMGAYGGYGPGPGMMEGYGAYGMGPGMMGGGWGGDGGLGPMGGYGPGWMHGYDFGALGGLELNAEQREKILKVQEGLLSKRWALMGKMHDQQFKLRELMASANADDAAVGKAYKEIASLRQQMWSAGADARKQIDAVLTPSQREQLQRGPGRGAK